MHSARCDLCRRKCPLPTSAAPLAALGHSRDAYHLVSRSLPPHHPQGGGWASPPFGRRLCTPRYSPPLPKCDAPLARRPRPRQPKRLHLVAVGLAALSGCYFRNIAQVAALFLAPFFSGAGSVGFGLLGGRNPGLHACNFRNAFRTFVNLAQLLLRQTRKRWGKRSGDRTVRPLLVHSAARCYAYLTWGLRCSSTALPSPWLHILYDCTYCAHSIHTCDMAAGPRPGFFSLHTAKRFMWTPPRLLRAAYSGAKA